MGHLQYLWNSDSQDQVGAQSAIPFKIEVRALVTIVFEYGDNMINLTSDRF